MRIAILGWGSLIWELGKLHIVDDAWHLGGPELPIELSRVSQSRGYLTYVIDPNHKRRSPTQYAISKYSDLENAIADLACRERCPATRIGYVTTDKTAERRARDDVPWTDIQEWTSEHDFDATIWTDLPPEFPGKWSLDNAVAYWQTIPADKLEDAKHYASSAPAEVNTDLRQRLVAEQLIPAAVAPTGQAPHGD